MSAKKENIEHFETVKKANLATSWTWKGLEMLTCKKRGGGGYQPVKEDAAVR